MKVYYPNKEFGKYVPIEQDLWLLWKIRPSVQHFIDHIKKCYFSKKKCQQYCDWENAPDIDLGGILQIKF